MTQRLAFALTLAALSGGLLIAQQPAPGQQPAPQQPPQQAAPQPPADQPPVTFRVEVNYVEVDAVVTDAQGTPATNLTKNDFELFEDGKRQDISTFSLVNIPIERAERPLFASAPVEADVQTNDHVEGRIYLIVLDDLHTDVTRSPRVKAAATRFIEQNFGTNDLAAVVFTGKAGDGQDFTNNPRLLVAAINKFSGRKLRSATLERIENARVDPASGTLVPGDDIEQMDRAFRARNMANSIRKLAEFMAGVRGRRKSMLLIGEGVDYDIYEAVGQLGSTASSESCWTPTTRSRPRPAATSASTRSIRGDSSTPRATSSKWRGRSVMPAPAASTTSCACLRTAFACWPTAPAGLRP